MIENDELETFGEVKAHVNRLYWMRVMQDKMKSLYDNHTYELVTLLKGKKTLNNKWVYKMKHEEGSSKLRYKARLVVKGFGQKTLISMKSSLRW